jgi:hypothetical protein
MGAASRTRSSLFACVFGSAMAPTLAKAVLTDMMRSRPPLPLRRTAARIRRRHAVSERRDHGLTGAAD